VTDEGQAIKTALLTRTALTTLTGAGSTARIWPHRVTPIAGYKPNDGAAIAFRTRGGGSLYSRQFMYPSVQFKVWGIDEFTAYTAGRTLVDVLDGKSFSVIRMAILDGLPQIALEQDTDWPFALLFFNIWLAM
jgi:hypothetical protein